MREELYADEVISCHRPTGQLLHTRLEIKCWSWAPFAAETWNANLGRRDHPSRAPAFHLCLSKKKSSRLTVVSLCTPGFYRSHFKSLSGYIFLFRETETQHVEHFIHLSLGVWQSKELVLALQSRASTLAMDHLYVPQGSSQTHGCSLLRTTSMPTLLERAYGFAPQFFHILMSLAPLHSHDFLHSLKLSKTRNNKAAKGQCDIEVIPPNAECRVCVLITLLIW